MEISLENGRIYITEELSGVRTNLIRLSTLDDLSVSLSINSANLYGDTRPHGFLSGNVLNMMCLLPFLSRPLTKEDKLNSRIGDLKEKNAALSKVNSELQEELKSVRFNSPVRTLSQHSPRKRV